MPTHDEISEWPTKLIEIRIRDWERVLRVWRRGQVRGQRTITRYFAAAPRPSDGDGAVAAQGNARRNREPRGEAPSSDESDSDGAVAEGRVDCEIYAPTCTPAAVVAGQRRRGDDNKRQRSPGSVKRSAEKKKQAKLTKPGMMKTWAPAAQGGERRPAHTDTRLDFSGASASGSTSSRHTEGEGRQSNKRGAEHIDADATDPMDDSADVQRSPAAPPGGGETSPATPAELDQGEPGRISQQSDHPDRTQSTSTDRREHTPG